MTTTNIQEMTKEQLIELVKKQAQKGNTIKVSTKGAVSVYGLGRFPVTLYASQWEKLISMIDDVKVFLETHASELSRK